MKIPTAIQTRLESYDKILNKENRTDTEYKHLIEEIEPMLHKHGIIALLWAFIRYSGK